MPLVEQHGCLPGTPFGMPAGGAAQLRKAVSVKAAVGVQEEQQRLVGGARPGVAGSGESEVVACLDHSYAIVERPRDGWRVVGRRIVDDHELVVVAQLREDGRGKRRKVLAGLVCHHNDRQSVGR